MSHSVLQELNIKLIEKEELENGFIKASFAVEPLDRSFGITLGNTLRRICLSHLEGTAVIAIKVKGINHEFASIPGVLEDTIEVILNCKSLVFNTELNKPFSLNITRKGIGEVYARDFDIPAGVEVVNPDVLIATVTEDIEFEMEIIASRGKGYVLADEHKSLDKSIDTIYIDSAFMPIQKFAYTVDQIHIGESSEASSNKFERLNIEMISNGAIQPDKALSQAAKLLLQRLTPFMDLTGETLPVISVSTHSHSKEEEQEQQDDLAEIGVETLNLSVRSYNCLKRANKNTLRDLVEMTTDELMSIKNFGRKSAEEVIKVLQERGFFLPGTPIGDE